MAGQVDAVDHLACVQEVRGCGEVLEVGQRAALHRIAPVALHVGARHPSRPVLPAILDELPVVAHGLGHLPADGRLGVPRQPVGVAQHVPHAMAPEHRDDRARVPAAAQRDRQPPAAERRGVSAEHPVENLREGSRQLLFVGWQVARGDEAAVAGRRRRRARGPRIELGYLARLKLLRALIQRVRPGHVAAEQEIERRLLADPRRSQPLGKG